jgi:hypothetical protein
MLLFLIHYRATLYVRIFFDAHFFRSVILFIEEMVIHLFLLRLNAKLQNLHLAFYCLTIQNDRIILPDKNKLNIQGRC